MVPEALRVIAPLVVAILGTALVAILGSLRHRIAAPLAIATAVLSLIGVIAWNVGQQASYAWAPSWNLRLGLASDGLARLYALLATGVGLAVLIYASGYMPRHLEHEGDEPERGVRFYALILLFMMSMTGLVMSQDLILLIIFWDLTAITSYYLIGFDHQHAESRRAALTALMVTVASAVCLIAAGAILMQHYDTTSIPELVADARGDRLTITAGVLIAVAALAKSAQVPFHFWLPRAMAAPTPVSAYLHSAAMVAAGVFLLGRMHPLLATSDTLLDGLVVVGFASIATGGVMALVQTDMKRLLAYSTIGQYGYVVVLLGLGEVAGAGVYVLAHALIKSALFMTAGAVMESSHETSLDNLGGLRRDLPWLAIGSGVASAGLAALPLTAGFFKDEVFFAGAAHRGGVVPYLAVAGAVLSFAYTWRFWSGIFLGKRRSDAGPIPMTIVAPIVLLGLMVLVLGVVPGPAETIGGEAGTSMAGGVKQTLDLAYHANLSAPNVMAALTWAIGVLAVITYRYWVFIPRMLDRFGGVTGPDQVSADTHSALIGFSRRLHAYEVQSLPQRLASIFVAAAVLVGATILFADPWPAFRLGRFPGDNWPLVLFLLLAALSGVVATRSGARLSLVLALSSVGYSLSAVYMFIGAPDVALVAVLIETMMTLLLLGVISLLPTVAATLLGPEQLHQRLRSRAVGVLAGAFAFVIVWGVLSRPSPDPIMARWHTDLAPSAHAADVVTAILADFRGLDTMGEITVIAIALLGSLSLYVSRRRA
jgi:multicomponent Na+:H+ antiporter subunit A